MLPDKPFPDWLTDEQRAASLSALLEAPERPSELWVFGYGSLLWKPAFEAVERRVAELEGYHRRFCIVVKRIRGTEQAPGLMMGLDEGGACHGVALRLREETARADLEELWRREMVSDIYTPAWKTVSVQGEDGRTTLRAISFVANRSHPRYSPCSDETAAAMIAVAAGPAGSCADYLFETAAHLATLGIRDERIESMCARVRQVQGAAAGS